MFRRLMATSATWITVPIRLGLGAVFTAHGAQKVLGSFNGPGLANFIPSAISFHEARLALDGGGRILRARWGCPDYPGVDDSTGGVPNFLHDAYCYYWRTLAALFFAGRLRVSNGFVGNVSGPADLWRGNGFHRSGTLRRTQEIEVANKNGKNVTGFTGHRPFTIDHLL
jgi:hypothetical protein